MVSSVMMFVRFDIRKQVYDENVESISLHNPRDSSNTKACKAVRVVCIDAILPKGLQLRGIHSSPSHLRTRDLNTYRLPIISVFLQVPSERP